MVLKSEKQPEGVSKWLETETAAWKQEGIITDDQARAIVARYRNREEDRGQEGNLVTVLAVIGALLLGTGVILFFAANWPLIPKWAKVSLIFSSIILAYGSGYYFTFAKASYPKVGKAMLFLGSILYGSGIWLIAQIFHISSHYPNGFLLWAAGILPVAAVCSSKPILIKASILLTVWNIMEQTGFTNNNWFYLPVGALTLYLAYRIKSGLAVAITLTGIVSWMAVTGFLSLNADEMIKFIYAIFLVMQAGSLIYAVGIWHSGISGWAPMKIPYKIIGLLASLFALYILSFRGIIDSSTYSYHGFSVSSFYIAAYSIIIMLAIFTTIMSIRKSNRVGKEGFLLVLLMAAGLTATIGAPLIGSNLFVIAVNVILFFVLTAAIVIGYQVREPMLVNFGLMFFVLDVIARYFDFFWDMLDKSVFFMFGGVLLILGGTLLERNRRKVILEMKVRNYDA